MKRWLLRGLAAIFGLVVLWLAVVWSALLPRIDAEQAAALAQMRAPMQQAQGQRNAHELFWLLRYEVPAAQQAAVVAEDAAALDAWRPGDGALPDSVAAGRYPPREAADAPDVPGCDSDCLAKVREDPDAWRQALAARQSRLAELRRLGEYDHSRSLHRPTLQSPIPAFNDTGNLQIAEAALAYADGDADAALEGLCGSLADWRRLKGRHDSLIAEMITLAWLRRGGKLYADIRAELPAGHPLPTRCAEAFGPPTPSQRASCDVWRHEFALFENALRPEMLGDDTEAYFGNALERLSLRWLLNREATLALVAPEFRQICTLAQQPVADWPAVQVPGCRLSQRLFNPLGCWLTDIAAPDYRSYLRRDRDGEGMLHLLQLADWLATQADPPAAFTARPEAFRQFEQPVAFVDGELSLTLLEPRRGQDSHWRIALPGSRVGPAGEVPDSDRR